MTVFAGDIFGLNLLTDTLKCLRNYTKVRNHNRYPLILIGIVAPYNRSERVTLRHFSLLNNLKKCVQLMIPIEREYMT